MFFRKVSQSISIIGILSGIFLVSAATPSNAAGTTVFSALGSGCVSSYSVGWIQANRYYATRDLNISAINFLIGNQSTANFSSSYLYIFSDNPSTILPGTILETFTPSSLKGSGSSQVGTFVGSYRLSQGTKFWIVPSVQASILPWCNWTGITTSNMTLNGISPDTSTTLSNSTFRRVNSPLASPPLNGGWNSTFDGNLIWQLSVEESSPSVAATLGTQSGSLRADFRTLTPLTVTVDTQSRVTFFANGRVIPGCRNILSSGGTAICNWRPSVHGSFRINASVNPVSTSYVATNTSTISVGVAARTNRR